jgi:hypothetical protein
MSHLNRATNGEYRVNCGKHLLNGKVQYKQFRLGKDMQVAERLFQSLKLHWEMETNELNGEKLWVQQSIDNAFKLVLTAKPPQLIMPQTPQLQPTTAQVFATQTYTAPTPLPADLSLFQAFDLFKADLRNRESANEVGVGYAESMSNRVESIKFFLTDRPLYAITSEEDLMAIRRAITARPNSQKYGKPISVDTVFNWLLVLGMSFDYFGRAKAIKWRPDDLSWREAFNLTRSQRLKLMTPDEVDGFETAKPTFTLQEIIKIYPLCTPWERMLVLLGICLAWTQDEIAIFRKSQFKMADVEYFIEKRRGKQKGNLGHWWICPELAALIQHFIAKTPANKDDLAFLTWDGEPLKVGKEKCEITNNWKTVRRRYLKETDCREFPFTRLRKFAGQMVLNVSGSEELVQVLLAQKTKSVANKFYVGSGVDVGVGQTKFQRLHKVQKEIYQALRPMFQAAEIADAEQAQKSFGRKARIITAA